MDKDTSLIRLKWITVPTWGLLTKKDAPIFWQQLVVEVCVKITVAYFYLIRKTVNHIYEIRARPDWAYEFPARIGLDTRSGS